MGEKFVDTKGLIKNHASVTDRQYNGHRKKDDRTSNDIKQ
jgi:hypothetical protein